MTRRRSYPRCDTRLLILTVAASSSNLSRYTRAHLGVETQRQWSDLAIARTTPCLLGLFSLVTLLAAQLSPKARGAVMSAAWYHKHRPTFSDTLAAVRRHFWQEQGFAMSRHPGEVQKLRPALQEGIAYALCHAA